MIRVVLVLFLISLGLAMVFHEQLQPICTVPYTDENFDVAHKTCYFLTELDDPVGQYVLALMYLNGQGVAVDDAKALKLFQASAEQGHAAAQYNLGNLYLAGQGVVRDEAEAVRWLEMAAEQGNLEAQSRLRVIEAASTGASQN
jgi:TPR repeat protein